MVTEIFKKTGFFFKRFFAILLSLFFIFFICLSAFLFYCKYATSVDIDLNYEIEIIESIILLIISPILTFPLLFLTQKNYHYSYQVTYFFSPYYGTLNVLTLGLGHKQLGQLI